MQDHPIFDRFDFEIPRVEGEFHVNNVGCRTRIEYETPLHVKGYPERLSSGAGLDRGPGANMHLPAPDGEDYYEWVDLLSAIAEANSHFAMVEVGAGYGRWIANAAKAMERFRGPRIKSRFFCGIEMQDKLFDWMTAHLDVNGVAPEERLLFHCGVSDAETYELVPIHEEAAYSAAALRIPSEILKDYIDSGKTHLRFEEKDELYKILKMMPLSDLLRQVVGAGGVVDIMHIDIQGAERYVLPAAISTLNRQVKRLHIGTHGRVIEKEVGHLLQANGWSIDRYYPCFTTFEAEFGPVTMLDGILSCRNGRFVPS